MSEQHYADAVNLRDEITKICRKLEILPEYVRELEIRPNEIEVTLFRGSDGRCVGAKYIVCENGRRATRDKLKYKCVCYTGGLTHEQRTYRMATETLRYPIKT